MLSHSVFVELILFQFYRNRFINRRQTFVVVAHHKGNCCVEVSLHVTAHFYGLHKVHFARIIFYVHAEIFIVRNLQSASLHRLANQRQQRVSAEFELGRHGTAVGRILRIQMPRRSKSCGISYAVSVRRCFYGFGSPLHGILLRKCRSCRANKQADKKYFSHHK